MRQKILKFCFAILLSIGFSSIWAAQLFSLEEATQKLIKFNTQQNNGQVSQEILDENIKLAKMRRDALLDALNKKIDITRFLLPKAVIDRLSNKLHPYIERNVNNLEGTLEVRAAFHLEKNGEIAQYLLHAEDNKIYYLNFIGFSPTLSSGTKIKIQRAFEIPDIKQFHQLLLLPNDIKIVSKAYTTSIPPDTFGQQKTIVILVNFQDQPTNRPWTLDQVREKVFSTVNNMYLETSYRQTSVIGDAIGWYVIPLNTNITCDKLTNDLPGLAQAAAVKAGVNLSSYARQVYLFPRNPVCSWAGLGTIGKAGSYSKAWINGYNDLRVIAHELGHNLGIWHSHFLKCPGSSTDNCTQIEYGDYADTMGTAQGTHFNAYQKERLGWLAYGVSPAIQTVKLNGQYTINPFEIKNANIPDVKSLKILKRVLPNGSSDYYYVEFRQGTGFDAPLSTCGASCDFTKGVLIHQGNSVDGNTSNLLDMTPADNNPYIVSLKPGQVFTDPKAPNGGITIKTISISPTAAVVSVAFGGLLSAN